MDIEGKHFPDEEDEHQSKTGKKIGKIIFRTLAFCSLAVYIICFARIFSSCDASLLEDVTFSDRAQKLYNHAPAKFITYKINTKDFMEYYGQITISNVIYASTANELEIGIKYNKKITDDISENSSNSGELEEFPLIYRLTDNAGNTFEVCNRINTQKGSYKFERVCFEGVEIDFSSNYLNNDSPTVSGEDVFFETEEEKVKFTLEIITPITNKSYKFVIYDDNTSYVEYEYSPD